MLLMVALTLIVVVGLAAIASAQPAETIGGFSLHDDLERRLLRDEIVRRNVR